MNAIERCVRSGPKKRTKTSNKGFPNHSTLINYDHAGPLSWAVEACQLLLSLQLSG